MILDAGMYNIIMSVMEMGNIVSKAGTHISDIPGQCATITLLGTLTLLLYPCPPVYGAPCLRGQCRLLLSSPWNSKSVNAYNYIHTGNGHTYTYTYTG